MTVRAVIGDTAPLVAVGIVLLLTLTGLLFIPRPLALTNRNHRLSRLQTGLMVFSVVMLVVAAIAICYVGRHHFSEGCMDAYLLVAATLGIITTLKIVIESEDQ